MKFVHFSKIKLLAIRNWYIQIQISHSIQICQNQTIFVSYELSKLQCKNFKMGKNMKTLKSREDWLDLEFLWDDGILGIKTYYTMTSIFQKKYSQFLKIITKLRMSICGKRRSSLVKSWIFYSFEKTVYYIWDTIIFSWNQLLPLFHFSHFQD